MNGQERHTEAEVLEALRAARGLLTLAAKKLEMTREGLRLYLGRHPDVAATIPEARESIIDVAEGQLFLAVERGQPWAIAMVLKSLGRGRGWGDQLDVQWKAEAVKLAEAYGLDPQRVIDLVAEKKRRRAG